MAHAVSEEYRTLCRAFLTLRTEEEVGALLEDLCTIKEAEDMAQRLYVASLLDGGANYKQISEAIGISTATISRVSRCLRYGSGGYRAVLDRLASGGKA